MADDTPSAVASYVQAFSIALEERGVEPRPIFDKVGISHQATTDPFKRISNEAVGHMFQEAIAATGDPAFGVSVGRHMVPANLHALGFALLASSTLRDFYQRVSRYYKMASQSADFIHYEMDGVSVLSAVNVAPSACQEAVDTWVALMVNFMRSLFVKELNPAWIELRRSCPKGSEAAFLEFFQCPVHFNCKESARIAMDASVMDVPLPGASPDLAQYNDRIVMDYLEKMDQKDIANRVRKEIVANLATGTLTSLDVAKRLNMSSRSMQSKLAENDTSFQEILDHTRQELAGSYMEQSHLAITEIAYLLGFSDASNFTRAFRRWHGMSPREYRTREESQG